MDLSLLSYYEDLEKASNDMLDAALAGNWRHVIKLETSCVLLISQLAAVYRKNQLSPEENQEKSRIMKRILSNDATIRKLTELYFDDFNLMPPSNPEALH